VSAIGTTPAVVEVFESDAEAVEEESTSKNVASSENVEAIRKQKEPAAKKLKTTPRDFTDAEHESWVEKHRDIISSLPRELFPTSCKHGENAWTTWVCTCTW
jgi:hypothetical protein